MAAGAGLWWTHPGCRTPAQRAIAMPVAAAATIPPRAADRRPTMRIAVLAYGSQGDVRPFVALGAGLRAGGHDVRIVTDTGFRPMVEAAGLDLPAGAGRRPGHAEAAQRPVG